MTYEAAIRKLNKDLNKEERQALGVLVEGFRMVRELKTDFGLFLFVLGNKDMLEERPVHYISSIKDEGAVMMLEYAAKRIKNKLKGRKHA